MTQASQLENKRELPNELPSNPKAPVPEALASELAGGGCYSSCSTPLHITYVWFEAGEWKGEVWTDGAPREVMSAKTLGELRANVEFFYGEGESGA